MSELTKLAEIMAKHLSNAFLSMASDFRKLNDLTPLSQTQNDRDLVNSDRVELAEREKYKLRDRVLVTFNPTHQPCLMTISEVLESSEYMAYHWQAPKDSSQKISQSQILGLDPKR